MAERVSTRRAAFALALAAPLFVGCGTSESAPAPTDAPTVNDSSEAAVPSGPALTASCVYTNPFSRAEECREYIDPLSTPESVATDCANQRGTLRMGMLCGYAATLGACEVRQPNTDAIRVMFPGADASQCPATQRGCTVFARGSFTPLGVCAGDGGVAPSDASAPPPSSVYQPAVRECRDPLPGEPRGMSEGGQVCTWSAVAGATEPGRRYENYASCERVRTQRPYYPVDAAPARKTPDPRMQDPAYVSELNWVRSQVEASACVCCHSSRIAPEGPSNWYLEAPGNWMDSFFDSGLALGAGWIDSRALGAYPASENNGFDRVRSGIPSTDPERMTRFFQAELAHRGRTRESFAEHEPFGGPIYDQLVYTPSACTGTDGIAADGTLRWTGGPARYLYVLDAGSASPGVPPNLDLPMGTRWRFDVAPTSTAIASGVAYGRTPAGATQRFPSTGSPAPLTPGATYYLYVLADVGIPVTRCLFTAPR